ncbi:MAG: radical SAM protein [bacterium]
MERDQKVWDYIREIKKIWWDSQGVNEKEVREKLQKVLPFPFQISIEITNLCNLKCLMCCRPRLQRKIGNMEFGLYKRLVDEISHQYVSSLYLTGDGEPLLHPQLIEMIQYAKTMGIERVCVGTNCMLLDEGISKQIISSGLDVIVFSVDAATQKTYQKLREGGDFALVTTNVRRFLQLKKEIGNQSPQAVISFIRMKDNVTEIESFIDMWRHFLNDTDYIQIRDYDTLAGQVEDRRVSFPENNRKPCQYLWQQMVIYWNGDVPVCCKDFHGKCLMGNVTKNTIEELWQGAKFHQLRQMHLEAKYNNIPLCKNCGSWWIFSAETTGVRIIKSVKEVAENQEG